MGYSSLIIPFYGLPQNSSSSKTAGCKSSALLKSTTLRLKILMVYCDTLAILCPLALSAPFRRHISPQQLICLLNYIHQAAFKCFWTEDTNPKCQQLGSGSSGIWVMQNLLFKNIHTVTSDSWLSWGVGNFVKVKIVAIIRGCHWMYQTWAHNSHHARQKPQPDYS